MSGRVIAAAGGDEELHQAIKSDCPVIFLLYGDILTIEDQVKTAKDAGKTVFVHVDLVEGLMAREISVEYLKKHTKCDGIISTKSGITRKAKELGLLAIQRIFLLDSKALRGVENFHRQDADFIEVLPGLMPKMIRRICDSTDTPVITGGLISDKADVIGALGAGAVAVSTTAPSVWAM